jgi:hypothetical protein
MTTVSRSAQRQVVLRRRGEELRTRHILMCQQCDVNVMEAVCDGETTNFRCVTCDACWHMGLGWVSRVNPATCPGCEHPCECRQAGAGLSMTCPSCLADEPFPVSSDSDTTTCPECGHRFPF